MRKLFLFIMLATVMTVMAERRATDNRLNLPGLPEPSFKVIEKVTRQMDTQSLPVHQGVLPQKREVNKASEAPMVKFTLKFPKMDEEWNMNTTVRIYNDSGYYEEIDIDNWSDEEDDFVQLESYEVELPAGTYDFFSKFNKIDPNSLIGLGHDLYYIVEDFTVSDGCVVELKPWESTVCIAMETVNPDGEKSRFMKMRYLENWDYEIIEDGNVNSAYMDKVVLFNDEIIYDMQTYAGVEIEPGPHGYLNGQEVCNFYVNPVSDKYVFREVRIMEAWPDVSLGYYFVVTECKGGVEGVYTNSTKYTLDDSTIEPLPISEQFPAVSEWEDEPLQPYRFNYWAYSESEHSTFWVGSSLKLDSPLMWKIWTAGPETDSESGAVYAAYTKKLQDASYHHEDWIEGCSTESSYIFPFAPGGISTSVAPSGKLGWYPGGKNGLRGSFPGPMGYDALWDDCKIKIAGSAPLLTFYIYPDFNWNVEDMVATYAYAFNDRYHSYLGSTVAFADVHMKFNGEEVGVNNSENKYWLATHSNETGKFEFEITTDNFEIDGIRGGNKAVVSYDTTSDDTTPPTVTMLQFRNQNNEVVQEFDEASEAEVLISATDLTPVEGEPYEWGGAPVWFEFSDPYKVTATCVPTGFVGEAYNEIELEKVDDSFSYGFGPLYRGVLNDVNLTSESGWFDMTIRVEDAAGNIQVQTLSPAFKIKSLVSGVQSIGNANPEVAVNGNNILAPAGSEIYNLNGQKTDGRNLMPGIYVVKTANKVLKIRI